MTNRSSSLVLCERKKLIIVVNFKPHFDRLTFLHSDGIAATIRHWRHTLNAHKRTEDSRMDVVHTAQRQTYKFSRGGPSKGAVLEQNPAEDLAG